MKSKNILLAILLIATTSSGRFVWKQLDSPTGQHLWSIYMHSDNSMVIVGEEDILVSLNGGDEFEEIEFKKPKNVELLSVTFVDDQYGWACGGAGETNFNEIDGIPFGSDDMECAILHTKDGGMTWSTQLHERNRFLRRIHFIDRQRGIALGTGTSYFVTANGGENWNEIKFQPGFFRGRDKNVIGSATLPPGIRDISCNDDGYCLAVGDNGIIMQTEDLGYHWSRIKSPVKAPQDLNAVYMLSPGNAIAVGDDGLLLQLQGTTFLKGTALDIADLNDVYFIDEMNGYAVGDNGTIIHTTNGGKFWINESREIDDDLYAVRISPNGTGYAVGADGIILKVSNEESDIAAMTEDESDEDTFDLQEVAQANDVRQGIVIKVTPENSSITVDDKIVGSNGSAYIQCGTGHYTVTAQCDGYFTKSETITVTKGKTSLAALHLQKTRLNLLPAFHCMVFEKSFGTGISFSLMAEFQKYSLGGRLDINTTDFLEILDVSLPKKVDFTFYGLGLSYSFNGKVSPYISVVPHLSGGVWLASIADLPESDSTAILDTTPKRSEMIYLIPGIEIRGGPSSKIRAKSGFDFYIGSKFGFSANIGVVFSP